MDATAVIATSRFRETVQLRNFRVLLAEHDSHIRQLDATRAIELRDDLSEESFNAIVRYVQEGDKSSITIENLAHFWKFAVDWNVAELYEYLRVWIWSEGVDVTALEYLKDRSDELEKRLQKTLVQQVKNPVFLSCVRDIGLDTIRRILEMNDNEVVRLHQQDLVLFMIKCVDLFGDEAWSLFKAVDFNKFTVGEALLYSKYPNRNPWPLLRKVAIVTWGKWGIVIGLIIVCAFALSLWRKTR